MARSRGRRPPTAIPASAPRATAGPQLARMTGTAGGRRVNLQRHPERTGAASPTGRPSGPLLGAPERLGDGSRAPRSGRPRDHRTARRAPGAARRHPDRDRPALPHRRSARSPNATSSPIPTTWPRASASPSRERRRSSWWSTLLGAGIRSSRLPADARRGQPGEPVVFDDRRVPTARTYTGSPHVASADGEVATTYDRRASRPGVVPGRRHAATVAPRPRPRFHVDPGRLTSGIAASARRARRFSRGGTQRHQRRRPARSRTHRARRR